MRKIRLVLQARMSSSRLPGKMLLPVNGTPLVVLCASRLQRGNKYDLVVATSTDPSDDALASTLDQHNINYIRGPLDDVLARFILAAEGLKDNDLIVRLTGDNPVVDSDFIEEIISYHERSNQKYTRSLSPFDRLPYGISAEVIETGELRRLNEGSSSAYEREHVTIRFTNANNYNLFSSTEKKDLSHLRLTVDTGEDYENIVAIFKDEDEISTKWHDLVDKLDKRTAAFRTPYKRVGQSAESIFALGTAQLGLAYGISNKSGQPSLEESKSILETALLHGVTWVDTAAAYGASEEIIGQCLSKEKKESIKINTKLLPEANTADDALASVQSSLAALRVKTIPYVLLHRWSQYKTGAWTALLEMQQQGIIENLGASIQNPEEGTQALEDPKIKFIQMPFNICDARWDGFIHTRRSRGDIHIQARSSLLQGLLTLDSSQWPVELQKFSSLGQGIQKLASQYNRKSIIDLCYAYVRSQDWIDSIVVGVDTKEHLLENLRLFSEPQLNDFINSVSICDETFLNPAFWPRRA